MLKKWVKKVGKKLLKVFSGDFILEKRLDRNLPFVVYLFVLVSLFITWNLYVESKLVEFRNNDVLIEGMEIEYHQSSLDLAAINERSKVETLLKKHGSKLHAPDKPPTIVITEQQK